jgi:hypothetical protein
LKPSTTTESMQRAIIPRTSVSVLMDIVRIDLHCGDAYAAQVLFDDICERMKTSKITVEFGHGARA